MMIKRKNQRMVSNYIKVIFLIELRRKIKINFTRGPISLAPEVFSCVRLDVSVLGAKPGKPRMEIFS